MLSHPTNNLSFCLDNKHSECLIAHMRAVLYRIGTHVCPSLANFWHLYKVCTLSRNFLFGLFANDQTRTQAMLLCGMLRNEWKERGPRVPASEWKKLLYYYKRPLESFPCLEKTEYVKVNITSHKELQKQHNQG